MCIQCVFHDIVGADGIKLGPLRVLRLSLLPLLLFWCVVFLFGLKSFCRAWSGNLQNHVNCVFHMKHAIFTISMKIHRTLYTQLYKRIQHNDYELCNTIGLMHWNRKVLSQTDHFMMIKWMQAISVTVGYCCHFIINTF